VVRDAIRAGVMAGLVAMAAGCSETSRLNLRCTAGDLERCQQLADMYADGVRVPRDLGRAAVLYQRVCDGGVAEVCNRLGELYEHVAGFEASPEQVGALYERACAGNCEPGCLNLGLFLQGEGQNERAAALFDRTCVAGIMPGCHQLALAYERGEGVMASVTRAIELYDEACQGQELDSCLALVTIFTDGEQAPVDLPRARANGARAVAILDEGCQAGIARDCDDRGRIQTRVALQIQAATAR
jgi:TPR repeat protein